MLSVRLEPRTSCICAKRLPARPQGLHGRDRTTPRLILEYLESMLILQNTGQMHNSGFFTRMRHRRCWSLLSRFRTQYTMHGVGVAVGSAAARNYVAQWVRCERSRGGEISKVHKGGESLRIRPVYSIISLYEYSDQPRLPSYSFAVVAFMTRSLIMRQIHVFAITTVHMTHSSTPYVRTLRSILVFTKQSQM